MRLRWLALYVIMLLITCVFVCIRWRHHVVRIIYLLSLKEDIAKLLIQKIEVDVVKFCTDTRTSDTDEILYCNLVYCTRLVCCMHLYRYLALELTWVYYTSKKNNTSTKQNTRRSSVWVDVCEWCVKIRWWVWSILLSFRRVDRHERTSTCQGARERQRGRGEETTYSWKWQQSPVTNFLKNYLKRKMYYFLKISLKSKLFKQQNEIQK